MRATPASTVSPAVLLRKPPILTAEEAPIHYLERGISKSCGKFSAQSIVTPISSCSAYVLFLLSPCSFINGTLEVFQKLKPPPCLHQHSSSVPTMFGTRSPEDSLVVRRDKRNGSLEIRTVQLSWKHIHVLILEVGVPTNRYLHNVSPEL